MSPAANCTSGRWAERLSMSIIEAIVRETPPADAGRRFDAVHGSPIKRRGPTVEVATRSCPRAAGVAATVADADAAAAGRRTLTGSAAARRRSRAAARHARRGGPVSLDGVSGPDVASGADALPWLLRPAPRIELVGELLVAIATPVGIVVVEVAGLFLAPWVVKTADAPGGVVAHLRAAFAVGGWLVFAGPGAKLLATRSVLIAMLRRRAIFLRAAAVGRVAALLRHLTPFRSGSTPLRRRLGPVHRGWAIGIPAEAIPRLSSDRAKRRCDGSSRRCRGRAAPSTASPPCDRPASGHAPASTSRDGVEATELSSLASQSVAASPTHRTACRARRAPATIAMCARARAPRADARCARASSGRGAGATTR